MLPINNFVEDSEYMVKIIQKIFFFENYFIMVHLSSLAFKRTAQLGMQQNSHCIFVNSYLV